MTVPQEDVSKLEQQRQEKLSRLRELGIEPYGNRYEGSEPAEEIKVRFARKEAEGLKEGDPAPQANCAGRIALLRDIGKLIFITLRDRSGTIQVGLSK